MSFNATVYITTAGYNLMAGALAGDELQFTRMGVGDGDMPPGVSENQMTALSNEVLSVPVQSILVENNNVVSVKGVITSGDAAVAFDFKELGLYATLNGGAEVLVGYGNAGVSSEYVDLDTTYSILQKLIDIKIPVTGLATISLSVSAQGYALQSDLVNLQNRVTITENDIATNATNIQTNTDAIATINSERVVKKFKTLYEAQRLANDGDYCIVGRYANHANWPELCNALVNYQTYSGFSLPSTDAFRIFDIKDDIILFLSEDSSHTYLVAIQFEDDNFTIKYGCHIEVTDTYPIEAGIVSFNKTYYIVLRYDPDGSGSDYKTRVLPFPYGWGDAAIPDITWGQLSQSGFCLYQKGAFPLAISYDGTYGHPNEFDVVQSVQAYPGMRRLSILSFEELVIPYNSFSYAEPLFMTYCGTDLFMGLGASPSYMSYLKLMSYRESGGANKYWLAPPVYDESTSSQTFSGFPITFFPGGGAVGEDSGTLFTFKLGTIDSSKGYITYGSPVQSPYQIGGTAPSIGYVQKGGDWISWKIPDANALSSADHNNFVVSEIPSTGLNPFSFSQRILEIGSSPLSDDSVSWRTLDQNTDWKNYYASYPDWSKYGLAYMWCDSILEYSEDGSAEAIILYPTHTDGGVYRKCGGILQYIGESL